MLPASGSETLGRGASRTGGGLVVRRRNGLASVGGGVAGRVRDRSGQ